MIIPTVIEQKNNTERAYDLYSCLLKERIIMLTGEIDDQTASIICAQLLYLDSLSHEDIQLYIQSPGGSVSAGLAIYDTMQTIHSDVSTIAMGLAASMAAILLSSGTTGKRYALRNAEVMIHQPLGGFQGQAKDIEIEAKHILKYKKQLNEILAEHCNQNIESIMILTDRNTYMSASEAVAFGLIDDIIQPKNQEE